MSFLLIDSNYTKDHFRIGERKREREREKIDRRGREGREERCATIEKEEEEERLGISTRQRKGGSRKLRKSCRKSREFILRGYEIRGEGSSQPMFA